MIPLNEQAYRHLQHMILTEMCIRDSSYTGITPKDKLRTLRMEMWPFTTLPLLISTVGAILFHLRYFEVRKYTNVQILEYLKTAGVIGLLYIAVQFLFMGWLVRMMKKQID